MDGDRVVRPRAALPGARPLTWAHRLVLLAVGLTLVLMHHVVGAHQHTPAVSVGVEVAAHGPEGTPHATAAALHVHHEDGGHDTATTVHDCLAVLAAAAAIALVLWLLRGGVPLVHRSRPGAASVRLGRSRPPAPVPVLLAQLQVLRL